jgi:hypothetical protein
MQIDLSDKQVKNVWSSIRDRLEFGSNVTVEREMQELKESEPRIVTEAGMQIDLSDIQCKCKSRAQCRNRNNVN